MERVVKQIADNKKAFFDYFISNKFVAGVVLVGAEVKSVRKGGVNLKDSYVLIKNNEVFLIGAHISKYDKADGFSKIDERRTRKLLLNKKEIEKLKRAVSEKGFTIIPTRMFFDGSLVKLEIGVAKGKELYNKKASIKEKDIKREMDKQIKNKNIR